MTRSPQTIPTVDDTPGNGFLRHFFLEERRPHLHLYGAHAGEHVLVVRQPKGADVEGLPPDVLGLDVVTAHRSGRDVLAGLTRHPSLHITPVGAAPLNAAPTWREERQGAGKSTEEHMVGTHSCRSMGKKPHPTGDLVWIPERRLL